MKVIERVHYSSSVIKKVESRTYIQSNKDFKPQGLWYSAPTNNNEDGWEHWCQAKGFCIDRLEHAHCITIDLDSLIIIRSGPDLDLFHKRFGTIGPFRYINWHSVAEEAMGIEIAPYLWSHRMKADYLWYYTWDCASGCVWDTSAILSWELSSQGT